MESWKMLARIFLLMAVAGVTLASAPSAGAVPAADSKPYPKAAGPVSDALPTTVDQVASRVEEHLTGLGEYAFVADTESHLGEKSDVGSFQVWFKKPHQLRVKILQGRDRDSELVVSSEGEIHGRKGGILKAFVLRLEPTDPRLHSLRGTPVTDLGWDAFLKKLRDHARLADASATVGVVADAAGVLEVVLTFPEGEHHLREVYRFDTHTWLPLLGDVYEDGSRVDHFVYHDVNQAPNLDDSWFRF